MEKKWKDIVDTFHRKMKSGSGGGGRPQQKEVHNGDSTTECLF